MERLTSRRASGTRIGWWSPCKKDELVQRLGAYEDTGLEPEEIKALEKAVPPKDGGWISVEEALPADPEETVLVIADGRAGSITLFGAYELAQYDAGDGGWWLLDFPSYEGIRVSWWMPLPAPPEDRR